MSAINLFDAQTYLREVQAGVATALKAQVTTFINIGTDRISLTLRVWGVGISYHVKPGETAAQTTERVIDRFRDAVSRSARHLGAATQPPQSALTYLIQPDGRKIGPFTDPCTINHNEDGGEEPAVEEEE